MNEYETSELYRNGDILIVSESHPNECYKVPHVEVIINGNSKTINTSEYVVLENYQPESKEKATTDLSVVSNKELLAELSRRLSK